MARHTFKENLIYYLKPEGWKLRYINQCLEGYHHFKVLEHNDPEDDWAEYSTKDGSEIVKTRAELN